MMAMDILRQVVGHKQERAERFFSFDAYDTTRWAELTAEHKIRDIDTSKEYKNLDDWMDSFKQGIKADIDLKSSIVYKDKTMADYEKEILQKHGEIPQASSLHEPLTPTEQGSAGEPDGDAMHAEDSERNSTACINEALKTKNRKDGRQDSAACALVLNCGGEVPASAVDYVTNTLQSDGKNDAARHIQYKKHLIEVDDETVLTLAQNKKDVYKSSKVLTFFISSRPPLIESQTKCLVDCPLKKNATVDVPVSTMTRYLVCPKSVEGWNAWLSTTNEDFKAGNMDIYIADSENQTYSSVNMQRDSYLVSFDMVAIESLAEKDRNLIQADLKFARDRLHYFFSGWWRCEFCNACFQSLAETTEHEETCSKADPQEIQSRRLKGKPDIGFANSTPCGDPDEREKMEDTARAFLEAVVDEDLTWRTSLPAEVEGGGFTLFHLFQTVFPSCANPEFGLKMDEFNDLAKELFPVRENVFPGIKKIFLGASLRDVKRDGNGSKFWKTFVNCLGVKENRVEEIQDIILQQKEAWENRLDDLLKKLPSHLDFLSLKNSRKLSKPDSAKKQSKKPENQSSPGKSKIGESAHPISASPENQPPTPGKADNAKPATSNEPFNVGDWYTRTGQVVKWDEKKKMFHVKLLEGKKCALKSANLIKIPAPENHQQPSDVSEPNASESKQSANIRIIVYLNGRAKVELTVASLSKVSEVIEQVKALKTPEYAEILSAFRESMTQGQKIIVKHGGKPLPVDETLSQLDLIDGDEVFFETEILGLDETSNSNVDLSKGKGNATKDLLNSSESDHTTTHSNLDEVVVTSGAKLSSKQTSGYKSEGKLDQPSSGNEITESDVNEKGDEAGSKAQVDSTRPAVLTEATASSEVREGSSEGTSRQSAAKETSSTSSAMEIEVSNKPELPKKKDEDIPMPRTKRTVSTNKLSGGEVQPAKSGNDALETEKSRVDANTTEDDVSKNKVRKSLKGKTSEGSLGISSETNTQKDVESNFSDSQTEAVSETEASGKLVGAQGSKLLQHSKPDGCVAEPASKPQNELEKEAVAVSTSDKSLDRESNSHKQMESILADLEEKNATEQNTNNHEQMKPVKRSKPSGKGSEVVENTKGDNKETANRGVDAAPMVEPSVSHESGANSKADDTKSTLATSDVPNSSDSSVQGVQSRTEEMHSNGDPDDDKPISTLIGTKQAGLDQDQGKEEEKVPKHTSRSKKSQDNANDTLNKRPGKSHDTKGPAADPHDGHSLRAHETGDTKASHVTGNSEKAPQSIEVKSSKQASSTAPSAENDTAKSASSGQGGDSAPGMETHTNEAVDVDDQPSTEADIPDKSNQELTGSVLTLIQQADEISEAASGTVAKAQTPQETKKVEKRVTQKATAKQEAEKELSHEVDAGKSMPEEHSKRKSHQELNSSFISLDSSFETNDVGDETLASHSPEKPSAPGKSTSAEDSKAKVTAEHSQKTDSRSTKHASKESERKAKVAQVEEKGDITGGDSMETVSVQSSSVKRKRASNDSSNADQVGEERKDGHRSEMMEQATGEPLPSRPTTHGEKVVKKPKKASHGSAEKKTTLEPPKDSSEKENSRGATSENTGGSKSQRRRQTCEAGKASGSALARNNHEEAEPTSKKRNRRESNDEAEAERQSTRSKRRCVMDTEKERQAEKERQQSLKKYIGMEVQKEFDGVMYRGKVVRISYDRTKKGAEAEDFFCIVYEDDDREQLGIWSASDVIACEERAGAVNVAPRARDARRGQVNEASCSAAPRGTRNPLSLSCAFLLLLSVAALPHPLLHFCPSGSAPPSSSPPSAPELAGGYGTGQLSPSWILRLTQLPVTPVGHHPARSARARGGEHEREQTRWEERVQCRTGANRRAEQHTSEGGANKAKRGQGENLRARGETGPPFVLYPPSKTDTNLPSHVTSATSQSLSVTC
eukprot:748822-Hanusia_phi.AAC.4